MLIGRLNKELHFYFPEENKDTYGQLIKTWDYAFTMLGATYDVKAKERIISDRQLRHHVTKMYIRYNDKINSKMRVNYKHYWYEITGVALMDREQSIELTCEEIEMNDNYTECPQNE